MEAVNVTKADGGLTVVAYPGDNKILLAMSLADAEINDGEKNFAGFAIWRRPDGKPEQILPNRIGFTVGVSNETTAKIHKWTASQEAPFQKFRWVDVPADGFDAPIAYRVKALYFTGKGTALRDGPEVTIKVSPQLPRHKKFRPAFTRGYIASQAYADKFGDKDIRPAGPKTPQFDTGPFEAQYAWLGADARKQLQAFIADCQSDKQAKVDVFAYDLDEPDVIAAICDFGREGRLRAILDNARLHTKPDKHGQPPPEVAAAQMIIAAAGQANVKQGHFDRYQHNKVLIKRDAGGAAQRVLFGSMNFSVRGIYVQANNVVMVDDPGVAGMFATAFDVAFAGNVKAAPFRQNDIAQGYMTGSPTDTADLPRFSLALSPHMDANVSLGPMSDRIRKATSSVLFAVMEPTGQGPVLATLRKIAGNPTVFSYGTVETDKGLAVQSPNGAMGEATGFAFLAKNVPPPFDQEFGGGPGMHIHDKFVVVDFNAGNPTVFAGSSNLAAGGEQANGDSLVMIEDGAVANMYAIEAVAVFDHFHFRKAMSRATKLTPLTLWYPGKPGAPVPWWKEYYDPTKIQLRDRCLFAGVPLPAGVAATKNVDWKALDEAAPAPRKTREKSGARAKKASGKKLPAGRAPAKRAAGKKAAARKAPAGNTGRKATKKSSGLKRAVKKTGLRKPDRSIARKRPARSRTGLRKRSARKGRKQ